MSNSLAVLIDHAVSESDSAAVGRQIIEVLVNEGLLLSEPNEECVPNGEGYPPGPRINEVYAFGENELRYWDKLTTIGVRVCPGRYVNFWAFPVFEHAVCPLCGAVVVESDVDDHEAFFDELYECVASFINEGDMLTITCPHCEKTISADRWTFCPDVGLAYLGIEFWNWPPFSHSGWKVSIPDLLQRSTDRTLSVGWGRM